MLDDVLCDLRTLDFVLAHGGRGWWYDAAGFLTLSNEHVWIGLTGLPPSRLQAYYARPNRSRLARRMTSVPTRRASAGSPETTSR
jgi:hypothetical protein